MIANSRLKQIRLLLLDVDGVLTDGTIIYSDTGVETKAFNVKDGLGIKLLMKAGIHAGIITGRSSPALLKRTRELGITWMFDNVTDKAAVLDHIVSVSGIDTRHMAFIGDDLPDLAPMKRVGLPIAVADADEAVIELAQIVTTRKGGQGAVREICEAILKAQDLWGKALNQFL